MSSRARRSGTLIVRTSPLKILIDDQLADLGVQPLDLAPLGPIRRLAAPLSNARRLIL
jgi:hypothetical protein